MADVAIFLSFETAIAGSATGETHEEWIPLDSAAINVDRDVTNATQTGDRNPGTPHFSDVNCTMPADKAAAELFFQAALGNQLGTATIHFVQTSGENANQPYVIWELGQALISSWSMSSHLDHPTIVFAVNYTSFVVTYNEFTGTDSVAAGTPKGYDLTTGAQV